MGSDEPDFTSRDDLSWRTNTTSDDLRRSVRWVPLYHDLTQVLGISDTAQWIYVAPNGQIVLLNETENYMSLLPLLGSSRPAFESGLRSALRDTKLPESLVLGFPVEKLVLFGLDAWGRHWPALALEWAETLGPSEAVTEALRRA